MGSTRIIVLCVSIHDVMKAEQVLQSKNFWCDMIPVPKEIDPSCGMALEIVPKDMESIKILLEKNNVRLRAFVQIQGNQNFTKFSLENPSI